MTVSTVASIAAGLPRTVDTQNTSASVSSPVAANPQPRVDVVSYPSELQKEGVSLRLAAQSIARTGSQLDAAGSGASQITSLISQLQGIATQASLGGITDSRRNALNAEFQSLRQQINNVATNSDVDGESLIAGNSSAESTAATLGIGGLTNDDLFDDQDLNVSTAENAQAALSEILNALSYVADQSETISAAKTAVDYNASTVESALQNQEAARSTISDSELTGTAISAQSRVQSQSADALFAQTNRLPADILQLLAE